MPTDTPADGTLHALACPKDGTLLEPSAWLPDGRIECPRCAGCWEPAEVLP